MKPLKNNIIVVQDGQPITTKSGIFINIFGSQRQHRPNSGTIESIGDNVKSLKVGDRIFFTQYSGVYFLNEESEDRILMTDSEVLGRYFDDTTRIQTFFDPSQFHENMKGVGVDDLY